MTLFSRFRSPPPPSPETLIACVAFALGKRRGVVRVEGSQVPSNPLRMNDDLVVHLDGGAKVVVLFDLNGPTYCPDRPRATMEARDVWPYTILGPILRDRFPESRAFCTILVTDSAVYPGVPKIAMETSGLHIVSDVTEPSDELVRQINICISQWEGAQP